MATILSFPQTGFRPNASSHHRKSDTHRRRASSAHWWTPIFGWPSDPDYIEEAASGGAQNPPVLDSSEPETTLLRHRFSPGCFTEEKAKQMRMKTMETETFHDIMYHSAIASRLASDLPNRSSRR